MQSVHSSQCRTLTSFQTEETSHFNVSLERMPTVPAKADSAQFGEDMPTQDGNELTLTALPV